MDKLVTICYRWLFPYGPCTFDEEPYFGSHVPLLSPSRMTYFHLVDHSSLMFVGTSLYGSCYEGASLWELCRIYHEDVGLFWGGFTSTYASMDHTCGIFVVFSLFYEGAPSFEDFYVNHLCIFPMVFNWEHGFGPLVSHAYCIFTWYFVKPCFFTHGLRRVPHLYKEGIALICN